MMKALVVETREDYPRGKAGGRTIFFLKGFFIMILNKDLPLYI
jgi:hypothetical protein